jgi:hypothetical protein
MDSYYPIDLANRDWKKQIAEGIEKGPECGRIGVTVGDRNRIVPEWRYDKIETTAQEIETLIESLAAILFT